MFILDSKYFLSNIVSIHNYQISNILNGYFNFSKLFWPVKHLIKINQMFGFGLLKSETIKLIKNLC